MIVAVIPARSGSKAIVDKNIQLLGDKPLLAWTIELCKMCPTIDRVIVSTDSQAYADIALKYGAEVPFLRPSAISNDSSTDLDFVLHLMTYLDQTGSQPDLLLHMRPTTPFRVSSVVENAIEAFRSAQHATSSRSVQKMSESAFKSLLVDNHGYVNPLTSKPGLLCLEDANQPRQSFPDTYTGNGYVDIIIPSVVKETGTLYGNKCLAFLTDTVIEIDEQSDLDMARKFLQVGFIANH